jgi:hypothetical protein
VRDHLVLRKFHAFRLKQALVPHNDTRMSPTRKLSISKDVMHAFIEKPQWSFMRLKTTDSSTAAPLSSSVSIQACPICTCMMLPSQTETRTTTTTAFDTQERCRNGETQRRGPPIPIVRRASLHRTQGAMHLVAEPTQIVRALLEDVDTIEGHCFAQFQRHVRQQSSKSSFDPRTCHESLCHTRDVIESLTQYILAYRSMTHFSASDKLEATVLAAVEHNVCQALAKPIREWTRRFTAHLDENALIKKMKAWSELPPTSEQVRVHLFYYLTMIHHDNICYGASSIIFI